MPQVMFEEVSHVHLEKESSKLRGKQGQRLLDGLLPDLFKEPSDWSGVNKMRVRSHR